MTDMLIMTKVAGQLSHHSPRHVVVGEGFGFEITHEVKHLLYMFFGGNLAIIVWKCS